MDLGRYRLHLRAMVPTMKSWPARLAVTSGLLILTLGVVVTLGWRFHYSTLIQLGTHLPPMTRNAAMCFLCSGLALTGASLRGPRWVVLASAGIVAAVSALTIAEYLIGVNLGVDELLGPPYIALRLSSPGRLAPVVAGCFALGSAGLLLQGQALSRRSALLLGIGGSFIAAVGLASATANVLGSSEVFGWDSATRIAFHTAAGLWVFGAGLLALASQLDTNSTLASGLLPLSATIAIATCTVGLWQALIAQGYAPFGLLPATVLGGGFLLAPVFGSTLYLGQRARAQAAALRRSQEFLNEAQRLSSTGSFSWLTSTDEIKWSDQTYRIFEVPPATPVTFELIGTRIHPEDSAAFLALVERCRGGGEDFEFECRLALPSDSIRHLHVLAHASRERHGGVEYIGAVQDVTERRLSEEALGKLRLDLAHVARVMSLGTLTASIAHEVNQPLAGIITNASTCLRMLAGDPPNLEGARETARRTIRDGRRASDVIARLRALFARRERETDAVDLNEAAREVTALVLSELQGSGAILRLDLAEDLPTVTGDRVQLQQVMLNLLRNAVDAMSGVNDRPRRLVISTAREENRVRLSVQDAGIGLDPNNMDRLFQAFYTNKPAGMGIGLSVSRSIVESHGGRLWATPNSGAGATFSFAIPCDTRGVAGEVVEEGRLVGTA
jgi:signal transduction histidine kinase